MKITVIGTGYVGLVSGTCFSEFGHDVTCVDKDSRKIQALSSGVIPIYEPGLEDMVAKNQKRGKLHFTTDLKAAVRGSNALFIAVGTPSRRGNGHADLQYVFGALDDIIPHIKEFTLIITKSTVPVGTGRKIKEYLSKRLDQTVFDVASNPEFLREGAALEDFLRPDRIIVGAESMAARSIIKELYRPLSLNETPLVFTNLETAELTKYAANAFLATKISFINEIADLCEQTGADVQQVAKGIGLDKRIGSKFLHAGPGYGGSCFPKDTRALVSTADEVDVDLNIVRCVITVNEERKARMVGKIINACGTVKGKKVAVLGITFKPNTDDIRESPALDIMSGLIDHGAIIHACDPKGIDEAKELFPNAQFHKDPYETLLDAEALVIVTEWNEFRALDLARVKFLMKTPTLVDLRNIYGQANVTDLGFNYHGVGRSAQVYKPGA